MNGYFRLSRLRHPRATFWTMLLLALVFAAFGLIAEFHAPAQMAVSAGPRPGLAGFFAQALGEACKLAAP